MPHLGVSTAFSLPLYYLLLLLLCVEYSKEHTTKWEVLKSKKVCISFGSRRSSSNHCWIMVSPLLCFLNNYGWKQSGLARGWCFQGVTIVFLSPYYCLLSSVKAIDIALFLPNHHNSVIKSDNRVTAVCCHIARGTEKVLKPPRRSLFSPEQLLWYIVYLQVTLNTGIFPER